MKVLVVIPCYYPAICYGGPVIAVHQMNRTLIRHGVDVTVYTTNANGSQELDVPLGEAVDFEGVKVYYFRIPFGSAYFYAPRLSKVLRGTLENYDLVHINWLYVFTTMTAARLCHKMEVPYILTPHGMLDSHSIKLRGWHKKILYLNGIERHHILNAEYVHYTSQGERDAAYIAGWGARSIVIPNGVDLSGSPRPCRKRDVLRKYPQLEGKKVVLFMGRLNYIKGLDLLLEAWPMVVKKLPKAHLVIAGPDHDGYMAKLKRIAEEQGVLGYVTFTGLVLGEEKEGLLDVSDVFVSSSHLESFGMAIVEAMSHGIPVVVTDRVNIKTEIQKAGAGLISSCESRSIADKLLQLLRNEEDLQRMGLRARNLVSDTYELSSIASQMVTLYDKICRG